MTVAQATGPARSAAAEAEKPRACTPVPAAARAQPRLYEVLGLTVLSDVPLPLTPAASATHPECVFQLEEPGTAPTPTGCLVGAATKFGLEVSRLFRDDTGDWVVNPHLGNFHLCGEGTLVRVYPCEGVDMAALAYVLVGQIPVLLLRKRGVPCLHAGAVVTSDGTVGFVGTNGQGKSTLAATFLQRGASLLSDDVLPLRLQNGRVEAGPSLPLMKLWPDSAEATRDDASALPTLWPGVEKRVIQLDETAARSLQPVPLDLLYVLERYDPELAGRDDILTATLPQRQGFATLLSHTCWNTLLSPAESARLFPLFSRLLQHTRVRVLRYPHGYSYQNAVAERIDSELRAR